MLFRVMMDGKGVVIYDTHKLAMYHIEGLKLKYPNAKFEIKFI